MGKQPIDPARLSVSFGLNDVGLVNELVAQGFNGPFLEADGRMVHEQGASEAQELACVLSWIVAGLRKLDHLSPETIVGATLAANQDMFLTLAKFRAIRLLWARVLEASGIAHQSLRLHGETSCRMMARLDPHTNILRATAAVFGAGLGGTDTFTVLPFSIAQGLPDAFARRMARNTQLILLEESHLWRVADPASGSGYVEYLTSELCEHAWTIFQSIEKTGKLPEFDSKNKSSDPVIGTNSHHLPKEFEAAVESISMSRIPDFSTSPLFRHPGDLATPKRNLGFAKARSRKPGLQLTQNWETAEGIRVSSNQPRRRVFSPNPIQASLPSCEWS